LLHEKVVPDFLVVSAVADLGERLVRQQLVAETGLKGIAFLELEIVVLETDESLV
jgi:hypothetical protein